MKTFYEFLKTDKIQNTNCEINENIGALLKAIPPVAKGIGSGVKSLGKYIGTGVAAGAPVAAGAMNILSKSLATADSEDEIEEILNNKIKESEKLLKTKIETHFKNFSVNLTGNLTGNLNKIIKNNMEDLKKKIDTALVDFIA